MERGIAEQALSTLPESYGRLGSMAIGWAEEHPGQAVAYGTAGGFLIGLFGVASVMSALKLIHSLRRNW